MTSIRRVVWWGGMAALVFGCSSPGAPGALSDDTVGTTTAAVTSTTSSGPIGESASPLPVAVSWGAEMAASAVVKTVPFSATITNKTQETATATVSLLGMGLDQRVSQVTLGTYTVAAGATQAVPVQLSDIPVQSVGFPSEVELVVVTSGSSWSNIQVPQKAMYLQFTSDFSTAYASTQSAWASMALGLVGGNTAASSFPAVLSSPATYYQGVIGNTASSVPAIGAASAQTLTGGANTAASRATAVGQALYNQLEAPRVHPVGRYKDASGNWVTPPAGNVGAGMLRVEPEMAAVQALYAWPSSATTASSGGTVTPAGVTPDSTTQYNLCAEWLVDYLDSGYGEPVLHSFGEQYYPSRYAEYIVWNQSKTAKVKSGSLAMNGCTGNIGLTTGQSYVFEVDANFAQDSATVHLTDDNQSSVLYWYVPFTVSSSSSGFTLIAGEDRVARTAAPISAMLLSSDTGLTAGTTVTLAVSGGHCGGDGADQGGGSICLGYDPDNNDNTMWKYVILHEFGHAIDYYGAGTEAHPYTYTGPTPPDSCLCKQVTGQTAKHCLQSWEPDGAPILEGWAHFYAATMFNHEDECIFVYYKQVRNDDGTPSPPPYATSCITPIKWMQNHCDEQAKNSSWIGGVEWDWMIFYWNVHANVAYAGYRLSMNDLFNVKRVACSGSTSGSCNGNSDLNYPMLDDAAQTLFGGAAAKYLQFSRRATEAGVVN